MSETSAMGSFGSKEENQDDSSKNNKKRKDDSPERYRPYCDDDSDTETYDTQALSIMDINDIIGVQTGPVEESTLESEIAALSEIIGDTGDAATSPEKQSTDEDKKDLVDPLGAEKVEEKPSTTLEDNKPGKEEEEDDTKDLTNLNNSLSLIGEAYISEDSLENDPDELHIGKEPKVVFSCKPLVDKRISQDISAEKTETIVETSETIDSVSITIDEVDKIEAITEECLLKSDEEKLVQEPEQTVDEIMDEIEETLLDDFDKKESKDEEVEKVEKETLKEEEEKKITEVTVELEERRISEQEEKKEEIINSLAEESDEMEIDEPQFEEYPGEKLAEMENEENIVEETMDIVEVIETIEEDKEVETDELNSEIVELDKIEEDDEKVPISTEETEIIHEELKEPTIQDDITSVTEVPADLETSELEKTSESSKTEDVNHEELDVPVCQEASEQSSEVEVSTEIEELINEEITNEVDDKSSLPVEPSGQISKDELSEQQEETIKPDGQEEEEVSLCSTNQEEYSEIFGDNNSQGTQEMVDRILDTVQSGLSSILEQQDNVNEEISEMLETTEDLSPTQNDLIEDLDKKLVSETEKLLEMEVKDDADNQGDLLNLSKEEEKEPVVDNDDDDGELNKSDDKSIEVLESKEQNEDVELLDKSVEEIVEPSSTGDSEIDEPKVDEENEEEKIEEIEEEEIEENKEEKSSEGEKSSENIILVEEQEEEIEEITEEILESSHELDTPEFEVSFAIPDEEKMDISDELLEDPLGDVGPELEGLQSSSQMDTELESAVKFLQESEENDIESPIILSSKFPHTIHSEKITVLAMDELTELPDNTEAMETENSMAITEAEIISEAAKLENEKKEELTTEKAQKNFQNIVKTVENKIQSIGKNDSKLIVDKTIESSSSSRSGDEKIIENPLESIVKKKSIVFPKTSILEERLKIPPKIEIPIVEPRICDTPSTPKTSLLIQRDARIIQQSKMLESPKSSREDQKITDTPKKDLEKSDFENVGSPRIILKIAKSAIADCAEQKSPKSPKVHSATHSPNPEDSPGQKLGKIKLKLSKDGHPSIIPTETNEKEAATSQQWHTEGSSSLSPLGMIIKLSKSGDASIVQEHVNSQKRTESPIGMKLTMKVSKKTGDASIIQAGGVSEKSEDEIKEVKTKQDNQEYPKRTDSPIGMKIKFSTKGGDTSIVPSDHTEEHHSQEIQKRVDSPSMKIKFSKKGGGTSIVPVDTIDESKNKLEALETPRRTESPQNHLGMKFKLSKSGDASIIHAESSQLSPGSSEGLGMKFKLSKSGDASIVSSDSSSADLHQTTESMKIKFSKTGHPMIVPTDETAESHFSTDRLDKSQITIEQLKKSDELSLKRKETIASPVEFKKAKIENNLSQILPEMNQDKKQSSMLDNKSSSISRNQMNVINQEISITHVQQIKQPDLPIGEKLKSILTQNKPIQEEMVMMHPRPELIIVNENSNSSQDVMIIDEMPIVRMPEVKIPKKRGRPRRIGLPVSQQPPKMVLKDPLMDSDGSSPGNSAEAKESERPKRTCRSSQKSYAPPKRGRGRGRGKRKMDRIDRSDINQLSKKARLDNDNYEDEDDDDDLTAIENRTTSIMTLDDDVNSDGINSSSELYKALRQPLKSARSDIVGGQCSSDITTGILGINRLDSKNKNMGIKGIKSTNDVGTPVGQNWLTPTKKSKQIEPTNLQVIDEETRMSAESFSRSQTPARQISAHGTETIINEESQGSVLSTATTESEKVKVKSRRMEINFDPDEGPFTVDKIAEYEWPLDRKGDTSMIQEQISQYLGVKSFKRKYPDLKRRMVDMEERNYLRENHLVSESMCDMGLTAVGSSEVLDIMCSDFPDHYEEYRKHMREKQIKEHSKKQKELTAAANAEKNRIDLAEMAVQSALSWNINFNKSRKETRKCSLDLQTFTIHVPKKQQKVEEYSKNSNYPVTLIPGQYTDYYREYTPAELRYYPLNTVIYGPMRPNERKFDSQSEGSQSDSDSDSSSDDSSCSSSEGTQDTEESQSTMDEVDIELSTQKDKTLKCKMCLKHLNKNSKSEILVQCGTCNGYVHPSCIDVTLDMVPHIQAYAWQCTDCKTCAQCHDPADEDKMLFCDMCDRGYHIYCVGLRRVPQGRWHCTECAICSSCGSRDAGGINGDRNGVAQWQHEYKKGEKNTRVYVSTLCVPCSKLWRKGRYCPHCSRCHTVPRLDLEENLVHCSACDKYLHLDCVENKDLIFDRKKYQCDLCLPKDRQHVVKNLFPKIVRG